MKGGAISRPAFLPQNLSTQGIDLSTSITTVLELPLAGQLLPHFSCVLVLLVALASAELAGAVTVSTSVAMVRLVGRSALGS